MKKINLKEVIILIIFNLILFQVPLMYYVSDAFGYIDEFIAVIAVIGLLFSVKRSYDLFTVKYLLIFIVYVVLTIIANYTAELVTNFNIIFNGMILFLRNFIILICVYNFSYKTKNQIINLLPIIMKEIKILLLVALILWPVNLIWKTDMTYDVRFGINSYGFIFHHPGNFVTYLFFILILLTYSKSSKFIFSNKFYICLTIFLLITTLRYTAIIALGIYIFYRIVKSNRIDKKMKFSICIILPIIVIIAAFPQISKYFFKGDTVRLLFYKYAFITLSNYPFGTGFATFGSYMAQVHYSPLYYQYGFNNYYGMSESYPLFLFDNFWPMIIAESGIIGTICVLLWFGLTYNKAVKIDNTETKIIILFLFACSMVGQTVIHFSTVIFYILMGVVLSPDYKKMINQEQGGEK